MDGINKQQLAEHLTATGAQMYGAFWCPHCDTQKQLFGRAVAHIPYVECDPEGENAQPQRCQEKGIQGYPTWEIDGEFYPGVHSLETLAILSGYANPE
jgi:glutaredoxin